jgi:hypothetical protein
MHFKVFHDVFLHVLDDLLVQVYVVRHTRLHLETATDLLPYVGDVALRLWGRLRLGRLA